jgi:predicted dehydrogenase
MMEKNQKLRTAIVGCGVISLDHVETIRDKCGPVELCFCDTNPEAMRILEKKYGREVEFHTDAIKLISAGKFDVVHILTPPDSHYIIAKHAIENGADVLVEKPMTLTLGEVESLYLLSEKTRRMICVGHSLLYMDCVLKATDMLKANTFGRIIAVHCFFGHSERRKTIPYGGVSHWSYNLPGGPLVNLISHPASLLVDLLGKPESISVINDARNLMPYGFSDLLSVSIQSSEGHGFFTISMAHGNSSRCVNIECEKGQIYLDLGRQLMIAKFHKGRLGFISKALSGFSQGFSLINGTLSVICKVATKRMKKNPGTRELVARFYRAVRNNLPCPVSKDNAIGVASILEEVIDNSSSDSHMVVCRK